MDYASGAAHKGLLPPHHRARALLQERRMTHCGMPHCDMPQLHRLPPGTIVNSVACEDAVSTGPDLFREPARIADAASRLSCRRFEK